MIFIYAKFLESRIHAARFIGSVRELSGQPTYCTECPNFLPNFNIMLINYNPLDAIFNDCHPLIWRCIECCWFLYSNRIRIYFVQLSFVTLPTITLIKTIWRSRNVVCWPIRSQKTNMRYNNILRLCRKCGGGASVDNVSSDWQYSLGVTFKIIARLIDQSNHWKLTSGMII